MPDVIVLYKRDPRVVNPLKTAQYGFFTGIQMCVAKALPDLKKDWKKVAVLAIGFDLWSENAPDIQLLVVASNTPERMPIHEQLMKDIAKQLNDYIVDLLKYADENSAYWPFRSLEIEIWPIMPPGFWTRVS